jgi:2-methylcitrate dehydratase PrpD
LPTEYSNQYIEAVSASIVNTRFEDLGPATVELAKKRIIDVLGCAIGGANAPGNPALLKLVKGWGGKKESSIWVHGGKASAQNVAMLNTIMARSFDFEVMAYVYEGREVPSHHACTVIPTALALGEIKAISGQELLAGMLVGEDLAARVQVASAGHPIGLGWDGCGTLSHLAATATASRLMGLDQYQTRMALGIVINTIASAIQSLWDGATTFKLGQGTAAKNAIFSAELAKAGWTGLEDALLSRFGYFFLYGGGCKDPAILTKDLGKTFYAESYFKPFPGGNPNHVGIDAALAMVNKHPVEAHKIAAVTITLPKGSIGRSYYAKPFVLRQFPQGDAIFSHPYTVCTTLVNKSCNLYNFTEEAIREPRVNALIAKTALREEEGLTGLLLTVKMKNGQEYSEPGIRRTAWMNNTSWAEIEGKFRHQVEFSKTVSRENSEKILKTVKTIEQLDDVNTLTALLKR